MTLHDLQIKKFSRMFGFHDHDKDGYMELADHLAIGERAAQLRGYAADSPEAEALMSKTRQIGEMFMQNIDSDEDGRISLAEWLSFHENMLSAPREQYLGGVYGGIQMMLDLADADSDDQLSLDEYRTFIKIFNVEYPDVPANFARLDLNGDGRISKAELLELMDQWYSSTDPAEPGNYLTGPF